MIQGHGSYCRQFTSCQSQHHHIKCAMENVKQIPCCAGIMCHTHITLATWIRVILFGPLHLIQTLPKKSVTYFCSTWIISLSDLSSRPFIQNFHPDLSSSTYIVFKNIARTTLYLQQLQKAKSRKSRYVRMIAWNCLVHNSPTHIYIFHISCVTCSFPRFSYCPLHKQSWVLAAFSWCRSLTSSHLHSCLYSAVHDSSLITADIGKLLRSCLLHLSAWVQHSPLF